MIPVTDGNDMMEYLVKQYPSRGQSALRFVCIYIIVFICVISFYFMYLGVPFAPMILFVAAGFWLIYHFFISPKLHLEYEYLYYNRTLSIDVIYGQRKRKTIAEYELEKAEIICPEQSERLKAYAHRTFEKHDFSSRDAEIYDGRPDTPYVLIYNGKEKIYLDLPEDFVKILHNNIPKKVFFD